MSYDYFLSPFDCEHEKLDLETVEWQRQATHRLPTAILHLLEI